MDGGLPCRKLLGPSMFKPKETVRIMCHAPPLYKWKSEAQRGQSTYQSHTICLW